MNTCGIDAAFRATTYRVATPEGGFCLRIGVVDAAFDAFLCRQSLAGWPLASVARTPAREAVGWGIVTAYNPGALLSNEQNEHRQRRLCARIAASEWRCFAGSNIADDGVWPAEPSYLVVPVAAQQVLALGREFGQLAVVFGRRGAAPELLWTHASLPRL